MAFLHALFAGAQILFGAIFAHTANFLANPTGMWTLRLEGAAMVAGGAVLTCVALGMARLRPWTARVAIYYAGATLLWAGASVVINVALRLTGAFDPPRNLFGLLLVILAHAIALLYDMTRKDAR
jgi:hypothetical protein